MPLIITPGQLERRAELYHQLGILLSAGMTIHAGLTNIKLHPPSRALQPVIAPGWSISPKAAPSRDAVGRMGRWMPSFDLALIEAGEQSGRLDACFKLLALYYQERAQMAKQVISDLLYPLFVFHFAIVLFPFISFVQTGNLFKFLVKIFGVLRAALRGRFFFLFSPARAGMAKAGAPPWNAFCAPSPFWAQRGAIWRWRGCQRPWKRCSTPACPSSAPGNWPPPPAVRPPCAARCTVGRLRSNRVPPPRNWFPSPTNFPDVFRNLYHTGEISGTLDETLKRLHAISTRRKAAARCASSPNGRPA